MNRAYILGAGFSAAISGHMPVLGSLSDGVRSDLRAREIDIGPDLAALGDNVEQWLTSLADPGPWLSDADMKHNEALFIEVSAAIYYSRAFTLSCRPCQ